MSTMSSDIGGPVLNRFGTLSGLLTGKSEGNREFPENVAHAVKPEIIVDLLNDVGQFISYKNIDHPISDIALARKARDITGLVSCWKN